MLAVPSCQCRGTGYGIDCWQHKGYSDNWSCSGNQDCNVAGEYWRNCGFNPPLTVDLRLFIIKFVCFSICEFNIDRIFDASADILFI